jgi:hypothetical protein
MAPTADRSADEAERAPQLVAAEEKAEALFAEVVGEATA